MKERFKELWKTHKKTVILGIAVIVSLVAYVVFDVEISPADIADKGCSLVGNC